MSSDDVSHKSNGENSQLKGQQLGKRLAINSNSSKNQKNPKKREEKLGSKQLKQY